MIKDFFFFLWIHGVTYDHVLWASKCTSEWRIALGVILKLTLTQHPRDEDLKPREVRPHLEVEPPWTWYYHIYPNFHTLVILLQVDPISSDKPKIVYEGFYEIENTFIFTWSSIWCVGHYHWLHDPICWLPPNSKANYLIHTIWHILNFM